MKNENGEFERIDGFISCLKFSHTFHYGSTSGTKRFVEHAKRCFPLTSTDHSPDDAHDHKLIQYKLNQDGIRKQVKLSLKENKELKNLYEKWICKDLLAFTIVEDDSLESLAGMIIKRGKKIDRKLISDLISLYNF